MSESDDAAETVTDVSQLFSEAELEAAKSQERPLPARIEPNPLDFLPPASVLCSVGAFVAVTGFVIFTTVWFDLQQSGIDGTMIVGRGSASHSVSIRAQVSLSVAIGLAGIAVFALGLLKRLGERGDY
jgi:hypothetical protein